MEANKFIITQVAIAVVFIILLTIGLILERQKPPINIVNHTHCPSLKETFEEGIIYGALAVYDDRYTNANGIVSLAYTIREESQKKGKK